jgi:plastocyanin
VKESSVISRWVCGMILAACATIALIGSTTHAQTGGEDDQSADVVAGKKVPPPPPPPPLQIAGSWTGTIQDSQQGAGTISFIFTEKASSKTKSTLKGSWTASFPATASSAASTDTGTQTGSVTAISLAITLSPKHGDKLNCKLVFNSIEATAANISGTYRFSGACKPKNSGTMAIQLVPQVVTPSVEIEDDFFSPANLAISAGQTVRWTNNGGEPHTVTSNPGPEKCGPSSAEAFASSTMNHNATFEHTFNNSGTFAYHCEVHGCPMNGTITVK